MRGGYVQEPAEAEAIIDETLKQIFDCDANDGTLWGQRSNFWPKRLNFLTVHLSTKGKTERSNI